MNWKIAIEQGNRALKASNWELALHYWSLIYEEIPNHSWAGVTLGLTLFRLNQLEEAISYLMDDLILHPDRELAFVYLAKITHVQANWELHAQQWGIILHLFPDYEWGMQSYANALKQIGELNKAERYFHMDVVRYPQHAGSYRQLIEIAIDKQQIDLASHRLETFFECFPHEIEAYQALQQTIHDQQDLNFYNGVYKPSYFKVHFTSLKQQNFMYALIPKIASTTTLVRLYCHLVGEDAPEGIKHDDMLRAFANNWKQHQIRHDYFKFAIVRNPYTRSLSAYLHMMHRPKSVAKFRTILDFTSDVRDMAFIDFLRRIRDIPIEEMNGHFCPQWYLLSLHQSAKYDFIGRFENLESDLRAIFGLIGDDDMSHISRRPHATYAGDKLQQYYGTEEQALVAEIYADDFQYLGYGYDLDLA